MGREPVGRLRTGTLRADDVVEPVVGAPSCEVPGGRLVLAPGGEPVTLSTSAAAIYDAVDGRRSIGELAEPVARRFGVEVAEVDAVALGVVRRLGALGLLANVAPVTTGPAAPDEAADAPDEVRGDLAGAEVSPCVAQRFDLERATLYNLRAPTFDLGIGVAGEEVGALVESLLGPFLVPEPLPLGLMVVSPPRTHGFVEPVTTIFDGSGYRAWRGRGLDALRSYLLALLSPLRAEADYPRCFVDYRSVARDGQVLLVHPYVLDDARLHIECRRTGWEPLPRLYTELDCRSGQVVLRRPFDPDAPEAWPEVQATHPVVGIHHGVSPHGSQPLYALESLVRRHLQIADGRPVAESLSVLASIAGRVPTAVASAPGGRAYLHSFRRLVAHAQGASP